MTTLSGCGQGLITVGGIAKPRRLSSWWQMSLDIFSDDDDTAGSQPDLMQWANATDLAEDAS